MKIILAILLLAPLIVSASEPEKVYKGKYVLGVEVNTFQECGSKEIFWVSASSWVLGPLKDYYLSKVAEPYKEIYIEFRGHLLNEELDGFASSYDGLIRMNELKSKSITLPPSCK